ncbi:nucleotide-binding alpha-beta plait domain-containing protein [Tanacetum coccineum]
MHQTRKGPTDFDKVMRDKATSFFFTNFSDTWDFGALWKMFSRYGSVVDVYIAFKKSKRDTRFYFVRFINIRDISTFEAKLKGILIGNTKLIINRAKFIKGESKVLSDSYFPPVIPGPSTRPMAGLPPLARNLGVVKKVLSGFDKILEVGQLDYDSKVLSPVKALFFALSLISPATQASDEDELIFEEEGIGPSLVGGGGDDFSSNFDNNGWDNERSYTVRLPTEKPNEPGSNNLKKEKKFNDMTKNVSHTYSVVGLDSNVDPHMVSCNVSSPLGLSQSMDSPHGPSCVKDSFGPTIKEQGQMPVVNHTPIIPHEDKEIDDLISNFHRLLQMANIKQTIKGTKKEQRNEIEISYWGHPLLL